MSNISGINFGNNQKTNNENIEITPLKAAFVYGGLATTVAGLGTDMYLSHSKHDPKKKLAVIDKIIEETQKLPKNAAGKIAPALEAAKKGLKEVIDKKYCFLDNIGVSQLRNDAEQAIKSLSGLGKNNEALKKLTSNKQLEKLIELGTNATKETSDWRRNSSVIAKIVWRDNKAKKIPNLKGISLDIAKTVWRDNKFSILGFIPLWIGNQLIKRDSKKNNPA